MRKKKILIVIALILIVISGVLFYLYLQEYEKVAMAKNRLLDNHCIAVNPLLIDTKTAYIGSLKSIIASDSAAYISAQYSWLGSAKEYMQLERQWLRKAQEFRKRSDVTTYTDTRSLEAFDWQVKIYQTEYEGIRKIVNSFDRKENINLKNLNKRMLEVEQEKNISQQSYNLRWGQNPSQLAFQNEFIKEPVSQCPEKNHQIPNIEQGIKDGQEEFYVPGPKL